MLIAIAEDKFIFFLRGIFLSLVAYLMITYISLTQISNQGKELYTTEFFLKNLGIVYGIYILLCLIILFIISLKITYFKNVPGRIVLLHWECVKEIYTKAFWGKVPYVAIYLPENWGENITEKNISTIFAYGATKPNGQKIKVLIPVSLCFSFDGYFQANDLDVMIREDGYANYFNLENYLTDRFVSHNTDKQKALEIEQIANDWIAGKKSQVHFSRIVESKLSYISPFSNATVKIKAGLANTTVSIP
ncbi:MAG: hypothetical protein ACOYL8_04665 [Patescibacteria group bacterium]